MPHGHPDSTQATAQNQATPKEAPNDRAQGEEAAAHPSPSTYAAPDVRDSTLAAPAAGEVGDYADLEEPSGGMAQGGTHSNRELHARDKGPDQGPKTQAANRRMSQSGSPDQGTH